MKLRNGFVSNSSSSSFVAVGYFLKREEIQCEELWEVTNDAGFYYYEGDEGGLKKGELAVGKEIYKVSSEDGEMEADKSNFTLTELLKEAEEVKSFLKEQGVQVTSEPKLFGGTRCS